jgi:signal transduction histidine kinase
MVRAHLREAWAYRWGVPAVALVCVAAVVWAGVLIARHDVLCGALWAAVASVSASAVAADRGGLDNALLFRDASWIGLAELLALGLLAGWATRVLAPAPLVTVLVAVTTAVVAISEWRQRAESNGFVNTALLIGLGGCVGAGVLLRRSDRDRALAADQARHDERLAIARELHDVVAHHVTGMVVQAQAGQVVAGRDPARAAATLTSIERAGTEALTAMRRLVGAMRTEGADAPTAPTATTLAELDELARHSTELGLPVRVTVAGADGVPPDVARSVHRIVRESLTNARRHASGASGVEVRVARRSSSLEVDITDDGRARSASGNGGFGLVGMAERVQALGGTFAAGPRPDGGWAVHVSFPLLGVAR